MRVMKQRILSVQISNELHSNLKQQAARRGTSIRGLITPALHIIALPINEPPQKTPPPAAASIEIASP